MEEAPLGPQSILLNASDNMIFWISILIAVAIFCLAALPVALIFRNMPLFQDLCISEDAKSDGPLVSVLIPARDEEHSLPTALQCLQKSRYSNIEVLVMDDHSQDRTAEICEEVGREDGRFRLMRAPDLPDGWNGKQHACFRLAEAAHGELLLFVDADVRLEPSAIGSMVARMLDAENVRLLSGFPRQITESVTEQLFIPMMHYVLLGYLPLDQMRQDVQPAFGAGCGQLFLADRDSYFSCGGHQAIQASRHDGLKLPRVFREHGMMSDVVDASRIASVRMYENWSEVRNGLLKNATEGIARWPLILIFSILLLGGSFMPLAMLLHSLYWEWPLPATIILGVANGLSFLGRLHIYRCVPGSLVGVIFHPFAVLAFVVLQWVAFGRELLGMRQVAWRGRS